MLLPYDVLYIGIWLTEDMWWINRCITSSTKFMLATHGYLFTTLLDT